jgi:hypothetical protein
MASPFSNINTYLKAYYGGDNLSEMWAKLKADLKIDLSYSAPYPLQDFPEDITKVENYLLEKINLRNFKDETEREAKRKKREENRKKREAKEALKPTVQLQIFDKKAIHSSIKFWHPDLNSGAPICNLITQKINKAKEAQDFIFLSNINHFTNLISNY